ncbi:MAG: type II toxin-antitoxin system antitoxin SocA domain-containing protein [Pseudomonadota bacterium]
MAFDGRAVANFVLDYVEQRGAQVTPLALQKIVYFCHVWSLVELGRPLIRHSFEAWEHGPVLQYLYREFKHFGARPIVGRAHRLNAYTGASELVPYAFDDETNRLLDRVVAFYARLPAGALVELTHVPGGPWYRVWHHGDRINPGMKIDDRAIERFYAHPPGTETVQ